MHQKIPSLLVFRVCKMLIRVFLSICIGSSCMLSFRLYLINSPPENWQEQCQKRIQECRAAEAKRLEARKKRWKEGAARARAWKEKKAKEAEAKAKEAEANAARKAEEEEAEQPGLAMAA
jgi:ATPase subunit of ABC transporter with duplicated ATPase domains